MTEHMLIWKIAQLLEGQRLSELDLTQRALWELLRDHYLENRDTQWVWLAEEHHDQDGIKNRKEPADLIYAIE